MISLFFLPTAAGGAVCFFLAANCQHVDRNRLVRRSALSLDIDSGHGQPARCPAWPTNIDDGLEDIRWIHDLGGESLPAASCGILSNLERPIFCLLRRLEKYCFLFSAHQQPIVSRHTHDRLTPHRPWCEDGKLRVGGSS